MTKHFSDDFSYRPGPMSTYSIADLYAAQSHLQAELSHPMAQMMNDAEFRKAHRDLDNVTSELRSRIKKMIEDYETT